jgi:hypothetical protein
MDRLEDRCWLDWWANSSTNLGGFEVFVVIAPTDQGWTAHGELIIGSAGGDVRDGFAFLCDLDPVFTLRFKDGSTIQVTITRTDQERFTLAEYTGQAYRQINYHADIQAAT